MTNKMSGICFYKKVSKKEYEMYKHIQDKNIVNVPKILSYDKTTGILFTEKINNIPISEYYGEDPNDVPCSIFDEIRNIVKTLYQHNIEYIDITGYNFIECDNKIWIIDFGHATFKNPKKKINYFLEEFITNKTCYEWNTDFA